MWATEEEQADEADCWNEKQSEEVLSIWLARRQRQRSSPNYERQEVFSDYVFDK